MPETALIRVFVSSPADQTTARDAVDEICKDLNDLIGKSEGFRLEPKRWERDARPGAGTDPQQIIDKQLGTDYEIYLGIMGAKFGTKTPRAGSGTEEEFDTALKKHSDGSLKELMFYFRDPRDSEEPIHAASLAKVQKFQEKLKKSGVLYWRFSNDQEFNTNVKSHLAEAARNVLTGRAEPHVVTTQEKTTSTENAFDPLENLNSLEDVEEDGYLELEEKAVENMGLFTAEINDIGDHTGNLGQKFTELTEETRSLAQKGPDEIQRQRGRIISLTSKHMDDYTSQLANSLPNLHEYFGSTIDATNSLILISPQEKSAQEQLDGLDQAMDELENSILESRPMVEQFRAEIDSFPNMTKATRRSKRMLLAVSADLLAFFDRALSQVSNLRQQIKSARTGT